MPVVPPKPPLRTPVGGVAIPRVTTQGDRNENRAYTPPHGVARLAAPHEVPYENSAVIEDPALREQLRSSRPTPQRIAVLERKSDEDRAAIARLGKTVGEVRTDVGWLRDREQDRIDREQAKLIAQDKADIEDAAAKKRTRRDTVLYVARWSLVALIGFAAHWLAGHIQW